MSVTVTLPDQLADTLKSRAKSHHLSLEEMVLGILSQISEPLAEDDFPTLEEVVREIQATPPNPQNIHPATQSLAELLANAPEDPDFDLDSWNRDWAGVEAELKAITLNNNIAEGRG
jgi:plasmid stability protein